MRTSTLAFAIALALGTTAAVADQAAKSTDPATGHSAMANDKTPAPTTATFVEKAAMGGMTEVELSKLALQKSKNEEVRNFANHMVNDHTQANEELKSIATGKNLQVPADLDAKHKAAIAELSKKSGAEFDRAYARQMAKDHDKTVALFNAASSASAVDPELQAFARKTLPTLKQHDHLAMQLNSSVDKGTASTTDDR